MDEVLAQVRAAYDRDPELEWRRLEGRVQARLEYAVTCHALKRHLPPPDRPLDLLDAGGGPGRYTIDLAAQGYTVTLLDLSPGLLNLARSRIAEAGPVVRGNVAAVLEGSITDPSRFPDERFDAVLCLGGVLSHVTDRSQRKRALGELRRVARPGAPLFISAMNRLSAYRGVVQWPDCFDRVFPGPLTAGAGVLENGALAYDFLPEELVAELTSAGLAPERVYGSTGIAANLPEGSLEALMERPERWRVWFEAFLATCDHPSIVGLSPHLLAVTRRPEPAEGG